MAEIRFFRMAEALARRGHAVDLVLNRHHQPRMLDNNLREVPFKLVRWEQYDVVKTFFHRGFETLMAEGGGDHPFIISKLGSVVGREETPGVHFHGAVRERLYAAQTEIAQRSKVVTVLTNRSAALWWNEHGTCSRLFQVPTGVDAKIPPPRSQSLRAPGHEKSHRDIRGEYLFARAPGRGQPAVAGTSQPARTIAREARDFAGCDGRGRG